MRNKRNRTQVVSSAADMAAEVVDQKHCEKMIMLIKTNIFFFKF